MASRFRVKYQSNFGSIHQMLITPEMANVVGTEPPGAVDSPLKAKVTRSRNAYGLKPRTVTASIQRGTTPFVYSERIVVPVLTNAEWIGPSFADDSTVNYKGEAWTIVGRSPERVR